MTPTMPRIHDSLAADHLAGNQRTALVSGPRQVGKTASCRNQAGGFGARDVRSCVGGSTT